VVFIYNTGRISQSYRDRIGWMIKFVDFEGKLIICLWTIIAFIDIRMPPFLGYFICRSVHITLSYDLCCLVDPDDCNSDLGNVIIRNVMIRLLSGTAASLFFTSLCWGAIQMFIYEVLLSLVFFNSCLKHLKDQIRNTGVLRFHNGIWVKYRQIQLLIQAFNRIYQTGVFAVYVAITMTLGISSGTFLVKIYRDSFLLSLSAFVVAIICYFCLGVMLSFASLVWTGSDKMNVAWRQNPRLMRNSVTRRERMCMRNMKIKIGSVNFVERMTPLVVLSFCVEQTIMFVLLLN
jgi:hypothetical protein